jgi:acyl-CoA reductase-like NAD-dependent aldehyde dehydrogenase
LAKTGGAAVLAVSSFIKATVCGCRSCATSPAPLGAYKQSGVGRESGQAAIDEYLQTKCVWLNLAEDVPDPFVLR